MSEGKVPQTFGEKLVFGIPAIIVALVLGAGVAFALVSYFDGETRAELKKTKEALEQATAAVAKDLETEKAKVATLQEQTKALKSETTKLAETSDELRKQIVSVDEVAKKIDTSLTDFKKGQVEKDDTQTKDITRVDVKIDGVKKRVEYIEEKIKRIDDLAQDVAGLRVDTDDLKGQSKALRADLEGAKKRQDLTEADLKDLGERTRQFQLRVLAARAREAADVARKMDLRNLQNLLDDVDERK